MSLSKGLRALARAPVRGKALTAGDLIAAGYPADGAEMPDEYARKLSVVDRCIEILSDSMAKLPIYLFDSRTRERIDHPLLYLLNIRANPAMAPSMVKKLVETCRLEGGNGYLWIVRDAVTARPQELIPVPWRLVQPWRDLAGRVWYDVTHPVTGEAMRLPQEDMIHVKGASWDGLTGVSVLRRGGHPGRPVPAAVRAELLCQRRAALRSAPDRVRPGGLRQGAGRETSPAQGRQLCDQAGRDPAGVGAGPHGAQQRPPGGHPGPVPGL